MSPNARTARDLGIDIAYAKAWGSLGHGVRFARTVGARQSLARFHLGPCDRLCREDRPSPGGVLIADENGSILGAIGISGDHGEQDEAAAIAGIEGVGLRAFPGCRNEAATLGPPQDGLQCRLSGESRTARDPRRSVADVGNFSTEVRFAAKNGHRRAQSVVRFAPALRGRVWRAGWVQSCVRPVCAVMTAGPDGLRRRGPILLCGLRRPG